MFTENYHMPLTLLGTGDTFFNKTRCLQSWALLKKENNIYKPESLLLQTVTRGRKEMKAEEEQQASSMGTAMLLQNRLSKEGLLGT